MSNTTVEILSQRGTRNRSGGVLKVALGDPSIAEVDSLIARTPNELRLSSRWRERAFFSVFYFLISPL
jgi:hypothetical protein